MKTCPIWPASQLARPARLIGRGWPELGAVGGIYGLALKAASREPAGRSLSQRVSTQSLAKRGRQASVLKPQARQVLLHGDLCRRQSGSGLGQLALWRLLSELDHASGCPKLRPAVANQPLGTVLAGRTGLAFDTDDDPLDQVVPLRVLVPLQGRSLRHRVHPARGRRRESGALGPLLGSAPAADHLCRKQGLYGRPAQPTRHRPRHPWRW